MNAQEFLESRGMELQSTCLITMVDGFMRQPNLCELMEEYAKLKIKEMDYKACEGLLKESNQISPKYKESKAWKILFGMAQEF